MTASAACVTGSCNGSCPEIGRGVSGLQHCSRTGRRRRCDDTDCRPRISTAWSCWRGIGSISGHLRHCGCCEACQAGDGLTPSSSFPLDCGIWFTAGSPADGSAGIPNRLRVACRSRNGGPASSLSRTGSRLGRKGRSAACALEKCLGLDLRDRAGVYCSRRRLSQTMAAAIPALSDSAPPKRGMVIV